jgi:D-alanyl-D-alanine carboxypeptidase (penicillin-binding protein 5/6)
MSNFRDTEKITKISIIALTAVLFVLCTITVGVAMSRTPTDQSPTMVATASLAMATPTAPVDASAFDDVTLQARSAIVVDLTTGETLYERNATTPLPLASITKLVTAVTAAESVKDRQATIATISAADLATEGEYGFVQGESLPLQELIDAMLVVSSNDAAMAVARTAGGTVSAFVKDMGSVAVRAGMRDSTFSNPSGLDVDLRTAGAYGSAKDVAALLRYGLERYPDVLAASRKSSVTVGPYAHRFNNTNDIVGDLAGILVSKTGYTDLAGGNLAVAFDAGLNRPVAIVVLGSTQEGRFADVAELASSTYAYLAGGATGE